MHCGQEPCGFGGVSTKMALMNRKALCSSGCNEFTNLRPLPNGTGVLPVHDAQILWVLEEEVTCGCTANLTSFNAPINKTISFLDYE